MTDKDALLLWMVKRGYWSNTCGDTIGEMLDELEFCIEEDRQCEKQFRGLAYEAGRKDENEACAVMTNILQKSGVSGEHLADAIRARREQ